MSAPTRLVHKVTRRGIGILTVEGGIGDRISAAALQSALRDVAQDSRILALVVHIGMQDGNLAQVAPLAVALHEFAKLKPTAGVCTSPRSLVSWQSYLLAAACSRTYISTTAHRVGGFDFEEMAGACARTKQPGRSAEGRSAHVTFAQHLQRFRAVTPARIADLASGCFTGQEAVRAGLVDGVDGLGSLTAETGCGEPEQYGLAPFRSKVSTPTAPPAAARASVPTTGLGEPMATRRTPALQGDTSGSGGSPVSPVIATGSPKPGVDMARLRSLGVIR